VLQWRGADGQVVRSLAKRPNNSVTLNIPVNNFAQMSWKAVVPARANGLQAISIEGQPTMMALYASAKETGTLASAPAIGPVVDATTGEPIPAAQVIAAGAATDGGPSPAEYATRHALYGDSAFDRFHSAISEYQPVYFLVGTHGKTTARFQISAKYRLFTPPSDRLATFGKNFYFAYTQTSLWDLQSESKPFVDTRFNPSIFWLSENICSSDDQHWRVGPNTGAEHASNGKDGIESRSINNFYLKPAFSYRFDDGSTLTFSSKIKSYFGVEDTNHDYFDYAGRVDWNLRWAQENGAIVNAMYRQGRGQRRTSQLDFAWPLQRAGLNMNGFLHLQYFNGYGKTLLGYNKHDSQFRIGLSIVP
jgi:outer membrane phospholipase A